MAKDAREALALLRTAQIDGNPYDIVLIDLVMPGMSGQELAAEILKDSQICKTSMILLTAYDAAGLGIQSIEQGFKAYLTKPIRKSQLFNCLIETLAGTTHIAKSALDSNIQPASVKGTNRQELILIAEDQLINQQVLRIYLEELGFSSHVVTNGGEAVSAVASQEYALVLMDCQMPEMDGFSATRAIRQSEAGTGARIPIIAVTAHAMKGDRENCLAAGMDDYISKPIEPGELKSLLEKWLPLAQAIAGDINIGRASMPIDLDLVRIRYGADRLSSLIELFKSESEMLLEKIRKSLDEHDIAGIVANVHGLKGIFASLYVEEMQANCTRIEDSVRAGNIEQVRHLFAILDSQYSDLKRYLETRTVSKSDGRKHG